MARRYTIRSKKGLINEFNFSGETDSSDSNSGTFFEVSCGIPKILVPKDNTFLFKFPLESITEIYQNSKNQLINLINILEDTVECVNVRDTASLQPKSVILENLKFSTLTRRRTAKS